MQTITIIKNDANQRIDRFLRKVFPDLKLGEIYKYFRTKKIKVNGFKVSQNYKLKEQDILTIYFNNHLKRNDLMSKKLKITFKVIYEDDQILVVFKPIGMLVHDDENKVNNTLINQVLQYLEMNQSYNKNDQYSFRPSLIHRLDRNTSGLLIIAKNAQSLKILNEKIRHHEIEKYYLAKVHGIPNKKSAELKAYLTKKPNSKIVTITSKPISDASKAIQTNYQLISHDQKSSILKVNLITGRTHQIRAHFNFINHPLFGEKKYTKVSFNDFDKYQALVAYEIVFNFKTDAGVLNYLKNKKITLPRKLINF